MKIEITSSSQNSLFGKLTGKLQTEGSLKFEQRTSPKKIYSTLKFVYSDNNCFKRYIPR